MWLLTSHLLWRAFNSCSQHWGQWKDLPSYFLLWTESVFKQISSEPQKRTAVMSGKENQSAQRPQCASVPRHTNRSHVREKKKKKSSSGESQLRLSERLRFLCANVCFPSAVPPFFLCVTATLEKTKQTFLLMKSNFVSHCIHLGHWREKGGVGGQRKNRTLHNMPSWEELLSTAMLKVVWKIVIVLLS